MADILIIDDDFNVCLTLARLFKKNGHTTVCVHSMAEGIETASTQAFDVVLLDVMLPDGNGLEILPAICRTPSNPEVIIITGAGNPAGVELAIDSGAWDYIEKSSSPKEMLFPLNRALQYREKKKAANTTIAFKREDIIGDSPNLSQCIDLLAQVSDSDSTVLITGETGTGKELFAKAIHANSARKKGLFVIVDCAALPESLVGSVLFGHKKGAFTGAESNQTGLIQQADDGTLFLDEVGELPLSIQKDFLRALQERRFRPVGGSIEVASNFRLVAATNRNLDDMVKLGTFRKDLLYRLNVFPITIPALRDRKSDIKALSIYHVARLCGNYDIEIKGFSPDFFHALEFYQWPGNVRELFNALDRAVTAAHHEPTLFSKHLPKHIRSEFIRAGLKHTEAAAGAGFPMDNGGTLPPFKDFRDQMEHDYLEKLMELTQGRRLDACSVSGLSRTRLFELLKKHSLAQ
ncbi:MAG: sigma-54 dependent transcriptional regulator [Pseudomonadota bacterium]